MIGEAVHIHAGSAICLVKQILSTINDVTVNLEIRLAKFMKKEQLPVTPVKVLTQLSLLLKGVFGGNW